MNYQNLQNDLKRLKNPAKAQIFKRFFKTGKGEYGEGDEFLGLTVPQVHQLVKKYRDLPLADIQKLLDSKIHEFRLTGLLIMVAKTVKAEENEKMKIINLYLANVRYVNNWDLVDLSAPKILGSFLLDKDRALLYKLADSESLWERRIAIVSTFAFLRNGELKDTIALAEKLLNDKHDLIHKAVGWALREVGKKDQVVLEKFLNIHYRQMPRTMLRYAIEKMDERKRKYYLKK